MAASGGFVDGDVPQEISDLLRDSTYDQLAGSFLMTGKGRRPSLPNVKSTNRVYMQMYLMRQCSGKSWVWVQESLGKLFPHYPSKRFRALIQKTYNGCKSANDPSVYLCQPVDLELVGPLCDSHGITRTRLLETIDLPKVELTNGLLLELETFRCRENLLYAIMTGWLNALHPDVPLSEKDLKMNIVNVTKKFTALNKSKKKYPKPVQEFISELYVPTVPTRESKFNVPLPSTSPANSTPAVGHADRPENESENVLAEKNINNNTGSVCPPKCKTCKSLRITAEQCRTLNVELTSQVTALKEVIASKNNEMATITEGTAHKSTQLDALQNHISKLKQELRSLQHALESSHQRKQTALKKQRNLQTTIESHLDTIETLKQTVCQLQSRVSSSKQRTEQYITERREMKKELNELKVTNDQLNMELNKQLFQTEDSSGGVTMSKTPKLKTRSKATTYSDNIRKCVMALQGEAGVSAKQCSTVIKVVAKHLFGVEIPPEELPTEKTALNMADEGHWLSKYQVGETLSKETWDLHSDGTTRDHRKIMGHQVTLKSGKSMSLGFQQVATEDSATLLDLAIELLQELESIVDGDGDGSVAREMLQNLCSVMSDRASVNKKFNNDLNAYRKRELETVEDIEFLYCNAHFLLGLSNKCEATLKDIEAAIESAIGHRLGRNQSGKFQSFKGGETSTARVVRTGSDCLGPRGDEKSGCRADWEAFCQELNIKSHISSFRMNRFNNFFYGAGALYHHRDDVVTFLSGGSLKSINLKLESVLLDLKSPEVTALLRALGIMYYKITGPYWNLMKSDTHYLDLHIYIQKLLYSLTAWSADASSLLVENDPCVFENFTVKPDAVYNSLFTEVGETEQAVTKDALEKLMSACLAVVEKQLADFLDGGVYGSEQSPEQRSKMSHCVLHNLMSEYAFGDLDYSQNRRRHSSLHHHSTIHMLRHNRTVSKWLAGKDGDTQCVLMAKARRQGADLRKKHRSFEQAALVKRRHLLRTNRENREKQLKKVEDKKKMVVAMTRKHGGPCTTPELRALERRLSNQIHLRQAIIWEMKFLKDVVGVKHESLKKIVGIKDVDILRANLLTMITSRPDAATTVDLPPMSSDDAETIAPVSMKSQQVGKGSRKRKRDHASEQPTKSSRLAFQFARQGVWVAVAYDRSWYLGQVVNVDSCNKGSVQFLRHVRGCLYTWPSLEDVEVVDAQHIFDSEFEVSTTNGRIWSVPQRAGVESKYMHVKHLYT